MGIAKPNLPKVTLFFGLLAASDALLEEGRRRLERDFSPIDMQSKVLTFTQSNYYEREMGAALLRQWVSTILPIAVTELVGIKHWTNRLEMLYADNGMRKLNIDPGYVALPKVVLATTKDYDHRIYVRDGIYEEVTLHYRRGHGWLPWPWTYPDYSTEEALEFFTRVREQLHKQQSSGGKEE